MGVKGEIDRNAVIVGDFNNPIDFNGQIFRAENQQEDSGLKRHTRSNGFN